MIKHLSELYKKYIKRNGVNPQIGRIMFEGESEINYDNYYKYNKCPACSEHLEGVTGYTKAWCKNCNYPLPPELVKVKDGKIKR